VKVLITFSRRLISHGHSRWQALPGSFAITATKGGNRAHLRNHAVLAPGLYRLTLTPAGGAARSIEVRVG
jgi:hypothetical protein